MSAQVTPIDERRGGKRELTPEEFGVFSRITETGALSDLRANAGMVAEFPKSMQDQIYTALTKAGCTIHRPVFDRLLNAAHGNEMNAAAGIRADDRPVIDVSGVSLDVSGSKAVQALSARGGVYRRIGALVRIVEDESGAHLDTLTPATMQPLLSHAAHFVVTSRKGEILIAPPKDIVNFVLNDGSGDFPELRGITPMPIIHADGSVRLERGYDPETKVIYWPPPGFQIGEIPAQPTQDDARAAAAAFSKELEFPYATNADRTNAIGAAVTVVIRPTLNDLVPLLYIGARQGGTGKTLHASLFSALATGQDVAAVTLPDNDAECSKTITALLDAGNVVIPFDNAKRRVESASLEAALTSRVWEARRLGSNDASARLRIPNNAIFMLTANNAEFGSEMARRTYAVMLDPKTARPDQRTGFSRPGQGLIRWVLANRGEIIARLITMIRAWHLAGRPPANIPAFGSFDTWAETVGGVLQYAGLEGFLGNSEALHEEANVEAGQWETFFLWWASTFHDQPQRLSTVANMLSAEACIDTVPDELGGVPALRLWTTNGGASMLPEDNVKLLTAFAKRLGNALRRKRGARFGDRGLYIEKGESDSHAKVATWRLMGNLDGL